MMPVLAALSLLLLVQAHRAPIVLVVLKPLQGIGLRVEG
jgi:hypothetical protein